MTTEAVSGLPRIGCMLCSEQGQDCGKHPDGESAGELAIMEEEQDIRERLRVDPTALTESMERCAGDIAYLGARAARAALAYGRTKIRHKKVRAIVYIDCKNAAVDTYGSAKGGATVDFINAMVEQDDRLLEAAEDELTEEVRLAVAKSNLDAAKARKDMLVQLGATQRAEMERDPVVRRRVGVGNDPDLG